MKRFTERDEYGNADIVGVESRDLQLNLEFDEMNRVTAALNRLARYEDLEEQGRLVELPGAAPHRQERITATARIPKEWLREWRVWVVLHGGEVLVPRTKMEETEAKPAEKGAENEHAGTD